LPHQNPSVWKKQHPRLNRDQWVEGAHFKDS
jgi:hypothetical protein